MYIPLISYGRAYKRPLCPFSNHFEGFYYLYYRDRLLFMVNWPHWLPNEQKPSFITYSHILESNLFLPQRSLSLIDRSQKQITRDNSTIV